MPVFLDDPISLDSLVLLDASPGGGVPLVILPSQVSITAGTSRASVTSGTNSVTVES